MTFIYETSGWPQFEWDAESLTAPLITVRHAQGRLLGRMESMGFDLQQESNLAALTSDVVKSSAIEGEELSSAEVRSSVARRLGLDVAGLPTPSRHVDGVVEMMLDATQNHSSALSEERLFGWHASLFPTGHSGIHPIRVGEWRLDDEGPMEVVSGPIGKERVHFRAPPADRLEGEMSKFLHWFNSPAAIDPVLKAGMAHFWFVTIHPFEDGNGRIARAIADMCLARADGTPQRFYSMSAEIESRRTEYYNELEWAQRGGLDITRWLLWFLDCLGKAIAASDHQLAGVLRKGRLWERINQRPVSERQRVVINRMLGDWEGFLTTSKYAKLAKCSTDTALRDIRDLVARGVLLQNPAKGRSTSYRLADL